MKSRLGPDFFIVGAPKCATTALNAYLAEHPAVFMCRKERHYFASDLEFRLKLPTEAEYFGYFDESGWADRRGEAAVFYLYAPRAAERIHAYRADARIIVMLRNPIDMLPSYHSQLVLDGNENIENFGEALAAEDDRRKGLRIPPLGRFPASVLLYRAVADFAPQLERYLDVFGQEQVHVVLYDDFAADTLDAYQRISRFLQVDPSFVPRMRVVGAHQKVRSRWLRDRILESYDPSTTFGRMGRKVLPFSGMRIALSKLRQPMLELNHAVTPRDLLDPGLKASLVSDLAPRIDALGDLVGRDLSHWYTAEAGVPAT